MKILVVDDEIKNINLVKKYGENKGYEIIGETNPLKVIEILEKENFDLLVLDIMMEQLSGFELAEKIKEKDDYNIIFLSAKQDIDSRIHGLKLGAIDYIVKPFSLEELFLKINNIIYIQEKNTLIRRDYKLDINKKKLYKNEVQIKIPIFCFELLYELMKNENKILTREYLLNKIWNTEEEYSSRTVDVHVVKLRKILKEDGIFIKTIRNKGYMYEK